MRYLLIVAVLAAFTLTACGDPKPAQYPPSLYKDFEDPLTDEALAEVQKNAEQRAEEVEEEVEEETEEETEEENDAETSDEDE